MHYYYLLHNSDKPALSVGQSDGYVRHISTAYSVCFLKGGLSMYPCL